MQRREKEKGREEGCRDRIVRSRKPEAGYVDILIWTSLNRRLSVSFPPFVAHSLFR